MNNARPVLIGIAVGIVVLIALGALLTFVNTAEVREHAGSGHVISFLGAGEDGVFVLEGADALVPAPLEEVGGVRVLESVPYPRNPEVRVVLASVPAQEGVALGLIEGGVFQSLLADGTEKYALSVTQDGNAIYGVGDFAPVFTLPQTVPDTGTDSTEELSTVSGAPKDAVQETPDTENEDAIISYNLSAGTIKNLGSGTVPRLIGGSAIVALASEGVVRIDPVDGTRTVILPHRAMDTAGSSISPDGMTLILKASTGALIDVFTLRTPEPRRLGVIAPGVNVQGVAFTDNEHVMLRFDEGRAALYEVPSEEVPAGRIIGSLITIR